MEAISIQLSRCRRFSVMRALLAAAAFLCMTGLSAQSLGELGFTTQVSLRLTNSYATKVGSGAPARLDAWKKFSSAQKGRVEVRESQRLVLVNQFLNNTRFI